MNKMKEIGYFEKSQFNKLKEQLDEYGISFDEYYKYYIMRQNQELINQLDRLNDLIKERFCVP